ncbi:MAG: sensor histidine kinase [Thiohalorhabdaceae bacterium]
MRFSSLQARLAIGLIGLFIALTGLLLGGIWLQARGTEHELEMESLERQARALAERIPAGLDGTGEEWRLPDSLDAAFRAQSLAYAVHDSEGNLLGAQPKWFGKQLGHGRNLPEPRDELQYFMQTPSGQKALYGLHQTVETAAGPLQVTLAQPPHGDSLIHQILWEFLEDLSWMFPVLAGLVLGVALISLNWGLRPLREAADTASRIGPDSPEAVVPTESVPREIRPLVDSVNDAFERLNQAVQRQRRFTADAAHQLRTPLAVLKTRVEGWGESEETAALRRDLQRMNRLVEQLLQTARLDRAMVSPSQRLDLGEVVQECIKDLAPLVYNEGGTIGMDRPSRPVWVQGDRDSIASVIRNLLENALKHSPEGGQIEVAVTEEGKVTVADQGPGLPSGEEHRVFERFWQGHPGNGSEVGAGLGLAIVEESMKLHGGAVSAYNRENRGVVFRLHFPVGDRPR